MNTYAINTAFITAPDWESRGDDFSFLYENSEELVRDFHKSLSGYAPTPLVSLPALSAELGLKEVIVKDESGRFGIKAFKALGASYAIFRCLQEKARSRLNRELTPSDFSSPGCMDEIGPMTFCAATDGNHGRAVAWTAKRLGQKAVIYMPSDTAPARIENIRNEGAEAVLVEGTFDHCVLRCSADAAANGWQEIADTAYEGYTDVPRNIMLGYRTIFAEIEEQLPDLHRGEELTQPDAVFLQAGVGGLAAAGTAHYVQKYGPERPELICVEPVSSDCFLESVHQGTPSETRGIQDSVMVGLNCGVPSPAAWPVMRDGIKNYIAIKDSFAYEAMRLYHREGVISGESGSSGLAGLLAVMHSPDLVELKQRLGWNSKTTILLINTEGDTDPENYKRVIADKNDG